MTANLAPDPEHVLEVYADATRIVASGHLVARFQASVAEERARSAPRPWSGALAPLAHVRLRLHDSFDVAFAPHIALALRLQALALVLLTVLALGALVGGAGAVVVQIVNGPDRGATLPGGILAPDASPSATPPITTPRLTARPTSRLPDPSPTATPTVSVRALAQEAPPRSRAGKRRKVADDLAHPPPSRWVSEVTHTVPMGESTHWSCAREPYCAS